MDTNPADKENSRPTNATQRNPIWRSPTRLFLLILCGCIALIIIFPARSLSPGSSRNLAAHQQVAGLVNAIRMFEISYSVLPDPGGNADLDIPTDPRLVDILTGSNTTQNPKAMTFLETKTAKPPSGNRPARGGLINHGKGSQSLVDPWGNLYMVRIDFDGDGSIEDPGGEGSISASVICWSFGKPSDRGRPASAMENDPEDWITSWR